MKKDPTIKDVYEIIQFMSENAATKDDLSNMATKDDIKNMATKDDINLLRKELKGDINDVRNEMIEHVDGFISLYKKHDSELAALTVRQNRVERKLGVNIKKNNLGLT